MYTTVLKYSWAVLLICSLAIISACTDSRPQIGQVNQSSGLASLVLEQRMKTAYFSLENMENDLYRIQLHNPDQLPIQAISFDLLFPAHLSDIDAFKVSDSPFALHLEKNNDAENGVLSVSTAQSGKAENITRSPLPVLAFQLTKKSTTPFVLRIASPQAMILDDKGILHDVMNTAETKSIVVGE